MIDFFLSAKILVVQLHFNYSSTCFTHRNFSFLVSKAAYQKSNGEIITKAFGMDMAPTLSPLPLKLLLVCYPDPTETLPIASPWKQHNNLNTQLHKNMFAELQILFYTTKLVEGIQVSPWLLLLLSPKHQSTRMTTREKAAPGRTIHGVGWSPTSIFLLFLLGDVTSKSSWVSLVALYPPFRFTLANQLPM